MATSVGHLALNLIGGYKASQGEISNEVWVNTLKLTVQLGSIAVPVGPLTPQFEVTADVATDSGTGWSAERTWRLDGGANDFDPLTYLTDQVLTSAPAWMALTGRSDKAILRSASLYFVGVDGKAIAPAGYGAPVPATLTWEAGSEPQGSSSSDMEALQVACVCSHRTSFAGRKGRGRMYLAGLVEAATDSQGQFTSTFMNAALAKQVSLLNGLSISGVSVSVAPAMIPNGNSYAVISSVRVGSKPDTQRRRARQLVETYVSDVV